MKPAQILSVLVAVLAMTACGTPGAPMPPSLQLPQPVSDLKLVRKADKVSLSWTVPKETTDKASVKHLGVSHVCRSLDAIMNDCGTPVAVLPSSQAVAGEKASYTDVLPQDLQRSNSTAFATYAIDTENGRGRTAGLGNQQRVTVAPTLPPPLDFHSQMTPEGPLLLWTGILHEHESPELGHFFRVYRRVEGSQADSILGEVKLRNQPQVAMPDRTFEWEKTYLYRITVVTTVTTNNNLIAEVEGDDSPPLEVFAHDVFPPARPNGLQAVFSGLEQQRFIDLTWAPNTEADLAGYNVYRHIAQAAAVKINADIVRTPAYRDADVAPGAVYFYSVSAVDLRGNESDRSEEAQETVPQ